jgi:ribosomal protein S18 acetylase RimI-like enzyme
VLQNVEIRLLTEADLPRAMLLKEAAGWNQTLADWRRLLQHDPAGCFAAVVDWQVVATTTTTVYRPDLAWVGMVLVDPTCRRRGLATRLVEHALAHLDTAAVRTVKLDATPDGQLVYERLGFETELTIERWEAAPARSVNPPHDLVDATGVCALREYDRAAFGADRSKLRGSLVADALCTPVAQLTAEGLPCGYALARTGSRRDYIGPVVADDAAIAAGLIDTLILQWPGNISVDVNTTFNGGTDVLADRGFTHQRDLIRMRRGERSAAGTSPRVFAIAGPEVG